MTTLTPRQSIRAFTFSERHSPEPYRCAGCQRRITDGGATVAILHVDGEAIEIDGLCCCENCCEKNAIETPVLEEKMTREQAINRLKALPIGAFKIGAEFWHFDTGREEYTVDLTVYEPHSCKGKSFKGPTLANVIDQVEAYVREYPPQEDEALDDAHADAAADSAGEILAAEGAKL